MTPSSSRSSAGRTWGSCRLWVRLRPKSVSGAVDEARRLAGIGRCGRQLCISSWLPEGRPVSLSLAKAQGLSLNPVQISGPCGRLLCCLHYEHDFYVQQRKRFPKEGKTLKTSVGNERVVSIDIFRERVTLRSDDGTTRVVTLD